MDYPLAVCDPTTIDLTKDVLATDRVSPIYQGENYYLKYRDAQRWYWLSRQQVDEVLVFVSFDSARELDRSCKYRTDRSRSSDLFFSSICLFTHPTLTMSSV